MRTEKRPPTTSPSEAGEAKSGDRPTPLARTLEARKPAVRVTPLDVFTLARRKWLEGERLDIGRLAKELGVGRATVFRWVGSREQLYGEILAEGYAYEMRRARQQAHGTGLDLIADVNRRIMQRLLDSVPLRRFIEQDPEFAIRVLTSSSSPVQRRSAEIQREWLTELQQAGQIQPALDIETLSYIIIRIGESFLYGDVLSNRTPDIEKAVVAINILVAARPAY